MPRDALEASRTIKVCFYIFFPSGGIGRYTNELMRTLAGEGGLSVEAICSPDYAWLGSDAYSTWANLKSISHPFPPIRRLRFLVGQFVNPARCVGHADRSGADIIHFSNINHLSFPYWKRKLENTNLRVAVTVHDVRRRKAIVNGTWETAQLKAFYNFADALFVHSRYQASELADFAGVPSNKIYVVPHGPYEHGEPTDTRDQLRANMGFRPDEHVALFFGNIRDDKNLDGFIRAMSKTSPELRLIVAGRGESRHRSVSYYRRLANELGVSSRTTFISRYIPDAEVADLFTLSDWIALPYHDTFTSQSGVLNVAAHYSRPVLVSSAPVLKETVDACDIGAAAHGDSVEAISDGIDTMGRLVRDGHEFDFDSYRETFSWKCNAECALQVYRRLVN